MKKESFPKIGMVWYKVLSGGFAHDPCQSFFFLATG